MAVAASTPSAFVAQCRPAGASRLPLRRRSSQNTTPARPVNRTVPSTDTAWPDDPVPTVLPMAWSSAARPSDGSTCHNPNSADETLVATQVPCRRRSRPHSTPRNATSSNSTVPTGISTNAVSSGVSPAEVIAGIAERAPGQRERRARREHHRDGADRGERPAQSTPPRSPAQAELSPAQPGPPGQRQQSRGAGRAQHQRRMRDLDVDHVDQHEEGDDEDDRPIEAPPGKRTTVPPCRPPSWPLPRHLGLPMCLP